MSTKNYNLENVKKKSDQALIDLTKKFDKFSVKKVSDLVVSQVEIEKSFKSISSKVLSSLRNAIIRVKAYHRKQLPKNNFYNRGSSRAPNKFYNRSLPTFGQRRTVRLIQYIQHKHKLYGSFEADMGQVMKSILVA